MSTPPLNALLSSVDPQKVRGLLSSVLVDGPVKDAVAPQTGVKPSTTGGIQASAPASSIVAPPQAGPAPRQLLQQSTASAVIPSTPGSVVTPMDSPDAVRAGVRMAPPPTQPPTVSDTATSAAPPPSAPSASPSRPAPIPTTRAALSDTLTEPTSPSIPAPLNLSPSSQPEEASPISTPPVSNSGGGFWSRLGRGIAKTAPYWQPAAVHAAAAAGNRAPLEDYERQRQLQFQDQLASSREQSAEATAELQRQALQNSVSHYLTPDRKSVV